MKERHWTSLVTSLRHGQCVLFVGQEIPGTPSIEAGAPASVKGATSVEGLMFKLAEELREDGRDVTPSTLTAVAQHYEDAQSFGPNALRACAQEFYRSQAYSPSARAPGTCCAAIQPHRGDLPRRTVDARARRDREVSAAPTVQRARR